MSHVTESSPAHPGRAEESAPLRPTSPLGIAATFIGTTIGAGPDTLVLWISQNAYQGDARYTVAVDGAQVGGVLTASALRGSGQSDTINVLANLAPGPHEVRLTFLNDRYDGTPATDRNLFLDGAIYNGVAVAGAVRQLYSAGPVSFGFTEGSAGSIASGLIA